MAAADVPTIKMFDQSLGLHINANGKNLKLKDGEGDIGEIVLASGLGVMPIPVYIESKDGDNFEVRIPEENELKEKLPQLTIEGLYTSDIILGYLRQVHIYHDGYIHIDNLYKLPTEAVNIPYAYGGGKRKRRTMKKRTGRHRRRN